MTVVLDIGCARHGGDYSVERLIEMFDLKRPDVLRGFDPNAKALAETLDPNEHYPCNIILSPLAAWTFDGQVPFVADGLSGWISDDIWQPYVPCFDLATMIARIEDPRIILKLDAEKSEFELLEHLIEHRVDALLELAIVEWHCLECGRGNVDRIGHRPGCSEPAPTRRRAIEAKLACELREWVW